MIFLHLSSGRKGEAFSAPPCTSLFPVLLCSGSFPEGARREPSPFCLDGSAGGRAVGGDGGRSGVR